MSLDLRGDGRVALITGAASGLGRAAAELFTEAGYRLALLDNDQPGGEALAETLRQRGGQALFFAADVADPAQVETAFEGAVAAWGGLDFVLHSAGILGPEALVDNAGDGDLARVVDVNLKGTLYVCKHAVRSLKRRGGGAIATVASIATEVGSPAYPAYCASKGGVVALTRSVARNCGRFNVRINCLCPGSILGTNLASSVNGRPLTPEERQRLALGLMHKIPLGRAAQPRDVAELALFLASPLARHIHGAILTIDGGESLRAETPAAPGWGRPEPAQLLASLAGRRDPQTQEGGVSHGEPQS